MIARSRDNYSALLNILALDYLKSCSILYSLNLIDSKIISLASFPQNIATEIRACNAIEIVELINLVEMMWIIKNDENSARATPRYKRFIIDFISLHQIFYKESNRAINYIKIHYPEVLEIISFIKTQEEIVYEKCKNKTTSAENEKTKIQIFDTLTSEKGFIDFLKDFKEISKDVLLKNISSLYMEKIIKDEVVNIEIKKSHQMSYLITRAVNVITPLTYVKSTGPFGSDAFTITNFSQLIQLSTSSDFYDDAKKTTLKNRNHALIKRCIVYGKNEEELSHYIRTISLGRLTSNKEDSQSFYDFLDGSEISQITSSKQDYSSLLSAIQYIKFMSSFKKIEEEIGMEIEEILSKKEISIGLRFVELELYISSIAIRLSDGIKIKNEAENKTYYNALRVFFTKNIKKHLMESR